MRRRSLLLAGAVLPWIGSGAAEAAETPGVTDSEIVLGRTIPLSGPVSAASAGHEVVDHYFEMVNQAGGIGGRRLRMITLDDGYSPPKTVEQTRKLVEEIGVFAVTGSVGTPTNAAVQKYLNARKVPQVLLVSGASRFNNPHEFPYSIPLLPNYNIEAQIYAKYVLRTLPDARIGVLYQNDDLGKDYLDGLHKGLGDGAARAIVRAVTYETSDPNVASQIITLREAGADTFIVFSTQKAGAQAVRETAGGNWKLRIVNSIPSGMITLQAAGLDKAAGLVTGRVQMDPAEDSPATQAYLDFIRKWSPETTPDDGVPNYVYAQAIVEAVRRLGSEVTRENLVRQVSTMHGIALGMIFPGITLDYTPEDYSGFHKMRLMRFDGSRWRPMAGLIAAGEEQ